MFGQISVQFCLQLDNPIWLSMWRLGSPAEVMQKKMLLVLGLQFVNLDMRI